MSQIGDRIKSLPLKQVEADCPDWDVGEQLYVRELTGTQRGAWEEKFSQNEARGDLLREMRVGMVMQTLIDGTGAAVFDDVEELSNLSGSVIVRLSEQAMEISGFLEGVEEAAGN